MDDLYIYNDTEEFEQSAETTRNDTACIGRVGAPPQKEATSRNYFFWIPRDRLVETTQVVTCASDIAGEPCNFYGVVDEVYRQSRKRSMASEVDEADGDVNHRPPLKTMASRMPPSAFSVQMSSHRRRNVLPSIWPVRKKPGRHMEPTK